MVPFLAWTNEGFDHDIANLRASIRRSGDFVSFIQGKSGYEIKQLLLGAEGQDSIEGNGNKTEINGI